MSTENKNKIDWIVFLPIVVVSVIIGTVLAFKITQMLAPKITPGEVWRSHTSRNPFKDESETNVVLAVSNGFVLYVTGDRTNSCSVEGFVLGSGGGAERIKEMQAVNF